MKKDIKIFLIFCFFTPSINCSNKYITHIAHKYAQTGDNLLSYSVAKWISWKYKIQLLYCPFPYSDAFILHNKEYFNKFLLETYKKNLPHFSHNSFNEEGLYAVGLGYSDETWNNYNDLIDDFTITQYSIPVSPKCLLDQHIYVYIDPKVTDEKILYQAKFQKRGFFDHSFIASRKNPDFLEELRKLISPKQKITYLNLPKDKISVAIHIRCIGKFEKFQEFSHYISLKVPSVDYYIDQLKRLSALLGNVPLFVYVFTNHSDPSVLVQEMKNALPRFNNITFASRNKNNQDNTFIEDLFLMSKFDCLIRSSSSFSMVAQLIGNHKIVIYPKRGIWKDQKLYIDKIGVMMIDQDFNFITPRMPLQIQAFIKKIKSLLK